MGFSLSVSSGGYSLSSCGAWAFLIVASSLVAEHRL